MTTDAFTMTMLSEPEVRLLDWHGTDEALARAAMVSTGKYNEPVSEEKVKGLLRYLLKAKHGTPFEHASMTFYISGPIFTFREFHRHRVGWSYNEMSARYTELEPEFYLPGPNRPMVNVGTSARPVMAPADPELTVNFNEMMRTAYITAWQAYKAALAAGAAKEMARICLPVGIYSRMHATCNPRSLMAFLALRTTYENALHPSHPQYEIEQIARKMEIIFADHFPHTHAAFNEARRVAP